MNDQIDYSYMSPNMVCPHCGFVIEDEWEYGSDDGIAECSNCEKDFFYHRYTSISYITTAYEKPLTK